VNGAGGTTTIIEGGGGGVTDHTLLTNIGVNTHAQIDTHITAANSHIGSTSNPHGVTKAQVGLGSVDNTADLSKPISTATQAYVDARIAALTKGMLQVVISGNGAVITTGVKGWIQLPYNCAPVGWTMFSDVAATAIMEVWKDIPANYPPTSADIVTPNFRPNVAANIYGSSTAVGTWNSDWNEDDILAFNVFSNNLSKQLTLIIKLAREIP
jgi:hypothetical protein